MCGLLVYLLNCFGCLVLYVLLGVLVVYVVLAFVLLCWFDCCRVNAPMVLRLYKFACFRLGFGYGCMRLVFRCFGFHCGVCDVNSVGHNRSDVVLVIYLF